MRLIQMEAWLIKGIFQYFNQAMPGVSLKSQDTCNGKLSKTQQIHTASAPVNSLTKSDLQEANTLFVLIHRELQF